MTFPSAAHSSTGRPTYQHDRHLIHATSTTTLYAVADGHGSARHGHKVSHHIVTTLPQLFQKHNVFTSTHDLKTRLQTAISSLDQSAIALTSAARVYAGSTLCALLRTGSALCCVNVGDSRAVVIPAIGKPHQLSTDHICDHPSEKARIENAGGIVIGGLLNGYISMSRAIGDDDLKAHRNLTPFPFNGGKKFGRQLFTADPDITQYRVRDTDLVAVIASDGVWGTLSNNDVATIVRTEIRKGRVAEEIAKAVVKKAISKGSKDNVTAVVAYLQEEAAVKMLVGQKRKRKQSRTGYSTPKSVIEIAKEMNTEDGSETAASSSDCGFISSDTLIKPSTLRHGHLRMHHNAEDKRTHSKRRLRIGQRHYSALR